MHSGAARGEATVHGQMRVARPLAGRAVSLKSYKTSACNTGADVHRACART
jgi:hypothetical protein